MGCSLAEFSSEAHLSALAVRLQTNIEKLRSFVELVEVLVDVDSVRADHKPALTWGRRSVQVRPSYSPALLTLHSQLDATWAAILQEHIETAKAAAVDKKLISLECTSVFDFHFRVTKKEEGKILKRLTGSTTTAHTARGKKSATITSSASNIEILSRQRIGTLFRTSKVRNL